MFALFSGTVIERDHLPSPRTKDSNTGNKKMTQKKNFQLSIACISAAILIVQNWRRCQDAYGR